MTTLREAALHYAGLKIHVLPLWWIENGRCACGKADCLSPGKHPLHRLVPNGKDGATNDTTTVGAWWAAFPRANIGIALAPSYLACVDIDPRNGGDITLDAIEAERGPVASDWMQRTGGNGTHFVFAYQGVAILPGKLGKGIDLVWRGYIVVEPSITAGAYQWLDGGPLDTEDKPTPLPDWIEAMASAPRPPAPTIAGDALGFEWMGDEGRAELDSAMESCPNWERDAWLRMGMVLHMLDPNPYGLGYELWEWWSQLGEGYKKFDPKDQARVWRSFTRKKDSSLHRESIFYWAREHGWRSTKDAAVDALAARVVEAIEQGPALEVQDMPAGFSERCPVPMIEETAAWISQHGGVFYPDASLLAALSLASLAASRAYQGVDGSPAHLYFGLSAQSVNELRYALTGLETILVDAGLRRMMRVSRFNGPGAFYRTLLKSPASLYMTSEWESLLNLIRRYGSGVALEQVMNLMADAYNRRDLQIDGADEFGLKKLGISDDQPVIRNPSMSMLALLSGGAWELLGKASEIGRGATELLFVVQCPPDGVLEHQDAPQPVPAWLIEHVRKVRRLPPKGIELDTDLGTIFQGNAELRPELWPVQFQAWPERFDEALAGITDRRALRPIVQGARITMRRLAVALAAWADPEHPVVTPAVMEWCAGYVTHHAGAMVERLDVMRNDDGKVDVSQRVLARIIEAGPDGIAESDIRHMEHAFKNLKPREKQLEILSALEEDGDIHRGKPKGRGRPGARWVASKFVVKEQANA